MENPFGAGRSLSTDVSEQISADWEQFQSLWNRARSFDINHAEVIKTEERFNPFGTGRVFRRTERIKPIYSPLFQSL